MKRLGALFGGRRAKKTAPKADRGFLVFENTTDVIRSEAVLKAAGYEIQVKGPPPEIRTGCDLVIEFPLILEPEIRETLGREGVKPIMAVPVTDPLLEPVSVYQVKDFGDYLMVRAANMKVTVDKRTMIIVNVSGGGCPDVPYLASQLVGARLDAALGVDGRGRTLCGYALHMAREKLISLCS